MELEDKYIQQVEETGVVFTHEDTTIEKQWHIFLNSVVSLPVYNSQKAVTQEEYANELQDAGVIPEEVTVNTLSFYFDGTYKEAYTAALQKCDELNNNPNLSDPEWEFEQGSIMLV